ncbi:hypothetical protein [Larkinella soli]|uniref:hypothetical protein n=1 Tax=Larkinella soli TaxID=1770527 RepID=UPI000FFB0BB9|nr:hypothetical protein [Larkinella soli]
MKYTTVYDISARGYEEWLWAYISAGLALATLIVFLFFRNWQYRYGLLTVAGIVILITFVIPFWDYNRLKKMLDSGDCRKAEGPVTRQWEKKWWDRKDGKTRSFHFEGFTVGNVDFGYYIQGGGSAAGFQNNDSVRVPIKEGMFMRVHYYPEPVITNGTVDNRILKIEVLQ